MHPDGCDSVMIPIDSSSFALLGMNQLLETIAAISETHNRSLRILVLTTMYNRRRNLDRLHGFLIPHQGIFPHCGF
jgi:cellulose biosynthesis protein BcsQ